MPSATTTALSVKSEAEAQAPDVQAFFGFFAQLKDLSPTVGFNMILTVHDENMTLRSHLKSKEEQVIDLEKKIRDCDSKKETAINEMFLMNEKERRCHQDTQSRVQELQKTLQEKDDLINAQNAALETKETQIRKAKAEFRKQTEALVQVQQEISVLQGNLRAKDTIIDQLKAAESGLKHSLSTTKENAKALEEKNSNLQQLLDNTRARLNTIEGFASGFYEGDEGSLIDDFTGLWHFAKTELYSQFKVDFTTEAISNGSAWTNLKRCDLVRNHHIPLPCSNTPPAKQIRLAIILAILAREIDRYIFQPCYIIPEDARIRKILGDLAMTDSEKESFCRSVLQSINTQAQEKALSSTIQTVVSRVLSYFDDLLTEAQRTSMRSSLEKIVRKAAGVWQPIRRAKRRYEPDFEQPGPDEYWLPFTLDDNSRPEAQTAQNTQDENALTIFPRLSVIENNRMTLHTVVIQLSKPSPLFCAASNELPKATSNSSVVRVMAKTLRSKSANPKGANQPDGHSNGTKKATGK
ncbi:hypothetical protein CBS147353_11627 [Aspergillus niger]|nr:hypothetical protein CBS147353_11627 [Aspergillus niger]